jgi:hypothetical protein
MGNASVLVLVLVSTKLLLSIGTVSGSSTGLQRMENIVRMHQSSQNRVDQYQRSMDSTRSRISRSRINRPFNSLSKLQGVRGSRKSNRVAVALQSPSQAVIQRSDASNRNSPQAHIRKCASTLVVGRGQGGYWVSPSSPAEKRARYDWTSCLKTFKTDAFSGLASGFFATSGPTKEATWSATLRWRQSYNNQNIPAFDAGEFLQRFRNSGVVCVGDSMCKQIMASINALTACDSTRPEWRAPGALRNHRVFYPSHNVSLLHVLTTHLTPVINSRANQNKPSFYKDAQGKSRPIKATGLRYNLYFGTREEGIKYTADWMRDLQSEENLSSFQNARVVVVSIGRWFHFRSDVTAFDDNGQRTQQWVRMFQIAIDRGVGWFDAKLNPKAMVLWMTYPHAHGTCSRSSSANEVLSRECTSTTHANDGGNADVRSMIRYLVDAVRRRAAVNGCVGDWSRAKCHHKPRQMILPADMLTRCRSDAHFSCHTPKNDGSHWLLPGVPDAWNDLMLTAVREDDRCRAISLEQESDAQSSTTTFANQTIIKYF